MAASKSYAQSKSDDVERRAASILEQMTLEEKIDYLGGVDRFYIRDIPRLGIPRLKMADGPLGVRNYGASTAMAAGIALSASWDISLAKRVGEEIARDARARGVHFLLGPGVNIYRAPMNGRNFEYLGEDPFLAAAIATAYIQGVQSHGVSATVKHFLGNNSEFDRRKSDAFIDPRALQEIYLPVFKSAVRKARVGAVMTSYNLVNGVYMSQNGLLNNDIVKKEWGFDGLIMSDWTSTFDGIEAANGGLDLEMPSGEAMNRRVLLKAVGQGKVTTETIDDKVFRILRTAVRFGWLDRDQTDATIPLDNKEAAAAALDAARGSMVLLKNKEGTLPLDRESVKTIAVIGPNAYPAVATGGGSAMVKPVHSVSFMEGLRDALKNRTAVQYYQGLRTPAELAEATLFYTSPEGGQLGLNLDFYGNADLSGTPADTSIESRIGAGEKTGEIPAPFTSARWTGYFKAADPGDYEIFVQIPGEKIGYRLYIDNALLIDAWKYSKALLQTKEIFLEGRMHKVVLEIVRRGPGYAGGKLRLGIVRTGNIVDTDAIAEARRADVVIAAVGFDPETESESGDRTFSLPIGQDDLVKDLAAANSNTVVVITSGGGVNMMQWLDSVPAVIAAWYPGQEGGTALAEILLGDVNPSGRLPVTFEKKWEDNPVYGSYYPQDGTDRVDYREGVFVGYRGYEHNHTEPLFPFGYGLSYTEFRYSNLDINPISAEKREDGGSEAGFLVSFDVKNTGTRSGAEVAQVYVGSEGDALPRPPKELKGFAKVSLAPGESKRVTITLNRDAFCYYDPQLEKWALETGEREILVGRSSAEIELKGKAILSVIEKKSE